jgi:hypothetical protein
VAVDSPAKGNGLKTAIDTIIAPKEAFEAIRTAPTWFWAFVISIVVAAACSFLTAPALVHATTTDWPNMVAKSPSLAGMSADQQQKALAVSLKIDGFIWLGFLLFVPIGNLIGAAVMALFNAISRGEGSFGKYWAATCNIGVVYFGVGSILTAAIVLARGTDSFDTPQALQYAVPSLALLAPAGAVKAAAFLAAFSPVTLWVAALNVLAMLQIGRLPKLQAWLTAVVLLLVPGLLGAAFAK